MEALPHARAQRPAPNELQLCRRRIACCGSCSSTAASRRLWERNCAPAVSSASSAAHAYARMHTRMHAHTHACCAPAVSSASSASHATVLAAVCPCAWRIAPMAHGPRPCIYTRAQMHIHPHPDAYTPVPRCVYTRAQMHIHAVYMHIWHMVHARARARALAHAHACTKTCAELHVSPVPQMHIRCIHTLAYARVHVHTCTHARTHMHIHPCPDASSAGALACGMMPHDSSQ